MRDNEKKVRRDPSDAPGQMRRTFNRRADASLISFLHTTLPEEGHNHDYSHYVLADKPLVGKVIYTPRRARQAAWQKKFQVGDRPSTIAAGEDKDEPDTGKRARCHGSVRVRHPSRRLPPGSGRRGGRAIDRRPGCRTRRAVRSVRFSGHPRGRTQCPGALAAGCTPLASGALAGKALELGDTPPQTILARQGDVLLMRPLLAHCSNRSRQGTRQHRRVLHLEFAASPTLPDGYTWHDFVPVPCEVINAESDHGA